MDLSYNYGQKFMNNLSTCLFTILNSLKLLSHLWNDIIVKISCKEILKKKKKTELDRSGKILHVKIANWEER